MISPEPFPALRTLTGVDTRKRFTLSIAAIALLLASGVASICWEWFGPASATYQANNEAAVQEAMFLHLLKTWGTLHTSLEIENRPVSQEMLERVRRRYPKVVVSLATTFGKDGELITSDTHEPAAILSVGRVVWHSRRSAEIKAEGYCGTLCADSATYMLTYDGGKWQVTGSSSHMVS